MRRFVSVFTAEVIETDCAVEDVLVSDADAIVEKDIAALATSKIVNIFILHLTY